MALFRYLRPIENAGIDPSLARSVHPSILTEVSKEVKKTEAEAKHENEWFDPRVRKGQSSYDVIRVSGFGSHEI